MQWSALACLFTLSSVATPWRFSNPKPHGTDILDMEFRDTVVWQIGDRGRLYSSQDLDQWIPHETGTLKSLRSIAFQDANIFISAAEGTILSGADPNHLTVRSLGTSNWLEGIAASPSAIVAVGDNGAIYSSENGVDWMSRGSYSTWLRNVAYGGDQFMCVGEDGFIATSPNGQNWQQRISGTTAHLNNVTWLQDRFWIVGDQGVVLTNNSQMAFSPVPVNVTNTLFTITASSNEVLIAGDRVMLLGNRSGGNWVRQADADSPNLAPEWPYYASIWDGRLFLAGGEAGMLVEGFRTNASSSIGWYTIEQATRSWLWSAARAPGFYVAVGQAGAIVTSEDGVDWVREAVPESALDQILLGVGGNTNVLVAVGSGGTLLRSENTVTNIVSTNSSGQLETNSVSLFGLVWNYTSLVTTQDLQGVAATDDLILVTGGNGRVFTSTDGNNWEPRQSGVMTFLSGAAAWPGGFVVVGASGFILTSTDAETWTPRNSGVRSWVYAVRYVGGKLVAVGEDGLILTSDNGVDWTRRESGTTEWLNDVSYASGFWQAAGSGGVVVTSTDAVNWTASRIMTSKSLYGAATDGDQVIMAGTDGVVIRRRIRTPTTPVNFFEFSQTGPNSVFLFIGSVDQQFVLEASETVLGPWAPVAELEISNATGTLVYELAADVPRARFFRTRLLNVP